MGQAHRVMGNRREAWVKALGRSQTSGQRYQGPQGFMCCPNSQEAVLKEAYTAFHSKNRQKSLVVKSLISGSWV